MPSAVRSPSASSQRAEALLSLLVELSEQLQPGLSGASVDLDSVLDRDLGFDSLSRVELLARVEERFGVALAEQEAAAAETPRELLRLLDRAQRSGGSAGAPADRSPAARSDASAGAAPGAGPVDVGMPRPERTEEAPEDAATLLEVLDWHALRHPQRPHILLYGDRPSEKPREICYGELLAGAEEVSAGLRERGLEPGQSVAIMLPTGDEYFYVFYGVLLAGGVPVPLYPPVRPSQLEDHLRRQARILTSCRAPMLVTVAEAKALARLLKAQVDELRTVTTVAELRDHGACELRPPIEADDVAFLQYTSGSTGQPKGVILTHANILTNLRTMGRQVGVTSEDVFVSWLPLYHDMGLIGAGLGSLLFAFPLVLMSPIVFLSRPKQWLWALHRHRGTLSAGPNFAYELCLNKVSDEELEGLDLSSWRLALNGAEPVSPGTVQRFIERFGPFGFRAEALMPVYGLAEGTLGAAFPPLGRGLVVDAVDRRTLVSSGRAEPIAEDDSQAVRFASCGFPLTGHQLRIVDSRDRELPERQVGRIQLHGPSCTQGYLGNPEANRQLLRGEWLDSGDLGYVVGGELYVTGRAKDIIIRAGRNLSPIEMESAVGAVDGVRKGCVAIFGVADRSSGTERLVVLAETREEDADRRADLRRKIVAAVTDVASTPPDEVVFVAPGTVLKTSSGKIRRSACRELFERGKLGAGRPAVWRQLLSLFLAGLIPQMRQLLRSLAGAIYSLFVWGAMLAASSATALLALLVPGALRRQRLVRRIARSLLRTSGLALRVDGLDRLPAGRPYVAVANHSSYADAVVVAAAMPPEVSIVAKAELGRLRLARRILRRIGVELVERFDREQGLEDSRRLAKRLREGQSLLYFPEGTFSRMPGLLPFRMGAFAAASAAGVPVVPVIIRGTRSLLRADGWRVHRVPVQVLIQTPIGVEGEGFDATVTLRDRSRRALLARLGEPDLAAEREEGLERLRALRQKRQAG